MAAFLEVVPRVVVEGRGVVWADLRGLPGPRTAEALLALAGEFFPGDVVRAGLAAVPIVAEVAARRGGVAVGVDGLVSMIEPGREREFLAPLPISLLASAALSTDTRSGSGFSAPRAGRLSRSRGGSGVVVSSASGAGGRVSRRRGGSTATASYERLLALLDGVGLRTCGELASLELAAVEVRFGAEGVRLWRLARGEDRRRLFPPIPPERPHTSLDFIDYQVTDPERLVFTINALLESITAALRGRGEHSRSLLLSFALAGGGIWRRTLRPARPTASREIWLRLARRLLEDAELPDAVVGIALEVESTEPVAVRQGDLFDRGFATAGAVEAAVARLLERQGEIVVNPRRTGHPLPERRVEWEVVDPFARLSEFGEKVATRGVGVASGGKSDKRWGGKVVISEEGSSPPRTVAGTRSPGEFVDTAAPGAPLLVLHLLDEPQPIDVETRAQESGPAHELPVRYRDRGGWKRVLTASGPDRISGGQWEEPYAREYFRCATDTGELVWLFHDRRRGVWFLHGWWG